MADQLVVRTDEGAVTRLTLSRPDKLNALNSAMLRVLRTHLEAIAGDESVRCVVLAGAGRSFSAGKDLTDVRGGDDYDPTEDGSTVDFLDALPQPTIGRIQGHCFTGGLELVLACDLLVAADDARICDTHAKWGIIPLWGMSVRLPERVGLSAAKRMMFSSMEVSGKEAARIGLVDESVPLDQLDDAVDRLANGIAAGSGDSNRIVKRLVMASPLQDARAFALKLERERVHGMPRDRAERLEASQRR